MVINKRYNIKIQSMAANQKGKVDDATIEGPKTHKTISSKVRFLSSNLASVISVTCCYPLEVMKTRIQI